MLLGGWRKKRGQRLRGGLDDHRRDRRGWADRDSIAQKRVKRRERSRREGGGACDRCVRRGRHAVRRRGVVRHECLRRWRQWWHCLRWWRWRWHIVWSTIGRLTIGRPTKAAWAAASAAITTRAGTATAVATRAATVITTVTMRASAVVTALRLPTIIIAASTAAIVVMRRSATIIINWAPAAPAIRPIVHGAGGVAIKICPDRAALSVGRASVVNFQNGARHAGTHSTPRTPRTPQPPQPPPKTLVIC